MLAPTTLGATVVPTMIIVLIAQLQGIVANVPWIVWTLQIVEIVVSIVAKSVANKETTKLATIVEGLHVVECTIFTNECVSCEKEKCFNCAHTDEEILDAPDDDSEWHWQCHDCVLREDGDE